MKRIPYLILAVFIVAGVTVLLRFAPVKPNNPSLSQNATVNTTVPMEGQDSFGVDVCNEIPKSVVEEVIGKTIEDVEDKTSSSSTGCTYYTNKDKREHILIQVSYLSVENQKKGQEALDRTITTNSSISMEHFIALQENGTINAIYLVMKPNKFVRIDRTANAADNDQLVALAKKVTLMILKK